MRYVICKTWTCRTTEHVTKVVQVSKSWRLDLCSQHRHLQTLWCHLNLPTHGLKGKLCHLMRGASWGEGPDLESCFFFNFSGINRSQWRHRVFSQGNNEVLGWGSPHNCMTSCTGRRRPLHLQKTHDHRPECHLTIDHAMGKYGKRHTWWDDTKCSWKRGSSRSESMCTQLTGMTEMTRQDSMTCASDLRSGMCDGQLVLLHRQISTDPHRTLYQVASISRKIQEVNFFETQRL